MLGAAAWGQVLFSDGGYTYLDVRSALENEDLGKVRNSVNIPMVNSVRKYNAKEKKKVVKSTKNKKWMADVRPGTPPSRLLRARMAWAPPARLHDQLSNPDI